MQYNPLYFASALCVLAGVYLITHGLVDWPTGQLVLGGVIQLYELLVIAGTALLLRRLGQPRPAVILALLATFFLLDPTLRTEGLVTVGRAGVWISAAWVISAGAKLAILALTFRPIVPLRACSLPMLVAAVVAMLPNLLAAPGLPLDLVYGAGIWFGVAVAAAAIWHPPVLHLHKRLDPWAETVVRRVERALRWLFVGFYHYHLLAWAGIYGVELGLPHAMPFMVLLPLVARTEGGVWIGATAALLLASAVPGSFPAIASLVALALAAKAWQGVGKRLSVGAVLAAYVGVWGWGGQALWVSLPGFWPSLVAASVLLALAWRMRMSSAALVGVLCLVPMIIRVAPQTEFEWGVAVLSLGFAALLAGIAINWWRAPLRPKPCDVPRGDGPSPRRRPGGVGGKGRAVLPGSAPRQSSEGLS